MITFLPYFNFARCADVLDDNRLGNQRNEGYTILETIVMSTRRRQNPSSMIGGFWMPGINDNSRLPWINHPATRMWKPYRWALSAYVHAIIDAWIERGYEDNVRKKLYKLGFVRISQSFLEEWEERQKSRNKILPDIHPRIYLIPHWLGDSLLHSTHRSKLLEKDFKYYSQFGWDEEPGASYYWPM